MSKELNKILAKIQENRGTIQSYGVKSLGLFGSYVKGTATKDSDMDFLVEFNKNTFDGYMDLKEFLSQLFNRQIDLVLKDSLKPRLSQYILKEVVDVEGL